MNEQRIHHSSGVYRRSMSLKVLQDDGGLPLMVLDSLIHPVEESPRNLEVKGAFGPACGSVPCARYGQQLIGESPISYAFNHELFSKFAGLSLVLRPKVR